MSLPGFVDSIGQLVVGHRIFQAIPNAGAKGIACRGNVTRWCEGNDACVSDLCAQTREGLVRRVIAALAELHYDTGEGLLRGKVGLPGWTCLAGDGEAARAEDGRDPTLPDGVIMQN